MARLFFKKLNESISRCSGSSLISLVFLVEFTDVFTAYLNFLAKPAFFLSHEMNPWIKEAFYYGQWEKLSVPWAVLIFTMLVFFLALTYLEKRKFLNFVLVLIIMLFMGAALTNICGIVFDSHHQGRFVFVLAETLFLLLLASIIVEQAEQFPKKKGKRNVATG